MNTLLFLLYFVGFTITTGVMFIILREQSDDGFADNLLSTVTGIVWPGLLLIVPFLVFAFFLRRWCDFCLHLYRKYRK